MGWYWVVLMVGRMEMRSVAPKVNLMEIEKVVRLVNLMVARKDIDLDSYLADQLGALLVKI